jgi:REP element-mobilizing transposase RayT
LSPWSRDEGTPIYTTESVHPVQNLRYDWTGWLRDRNPFPPTLDQAMAHCRGAWRSDGITLDHWHVEGRRIQFLFTVDPVVSPACCAQRAKGRLQHALRRAGTPVSFSRRIGFRTLGDNTREIVEQYVVSQVGRSDYADARFRDYIDQFTVGNPSARLAKPFVSGHGRYWYNLHLVIVVQDRRCPMTRHETFVVVREESMRLAASFGHELSVMPDHVHIVLRGNIQTSPLEVGLEFLNGLSLALGNNRCWSEEFYVGTFSEYAVGKILKH